MLTENLGNLHRTYYNFQQLPEASPELSSSFVTVLQIKSLPELQRSVMQVICAFEQPT